MVCTPRNIIHRYTSVKYFTLSCMRVYNNETFLAFSNCFRSKIGEAAHTFLKLNWHTIWCFFYLRVVLCGNKLLLYAWFCYLVEFLYVVCLKPTVLLLLHNIQLKVDNLCIPLNNFLSKFIFDFNSNTFFLVITSFFYEREKL